MGMVKGENVEYWVLGRKLQNTNSQINGVASVYRQFFNNKEQYVYTHGLDRINEHAHCEEP